MRIFVVLLTWLGMSLSALAFDLDQQQDFLHPDDAFQWSWSKTQGELQVQFQIEPGYYLYREQFSLTTAAGRELPLTTPPATTITDEFFGETDVYFDQVELTTAELPNGELTLRWQGCAEAGLCYPPQTTSWVVNDTPANATGTSTTPAVEQSALTAEATAETARPAGSDTAGQVAASAEQNIAEQLRNTGGWWFLLAFFGMGLLLTFTPCVLPMLPIISGLVMGQNARGWKAFVLGLAYVIPMALTYAVLGVLAALAGANLQATLQSPVILWSFAAVFAALAAAMFGWFELQLPAKLRNKLDQLSRGQQGGHLWGAAVLGVLSALLVGPCMTAPLAGTLLFIADSGNLWLGGSALLALGLGMGAPLLLAITLGMRVLPQPGPWMSRVKAGFGFVLLGTAIWFLSRILAPQTVLLMWSALALGLAVSGWQLTLALTGRNRVLTQWAVLLVGGWSFLLLLGAAGGATQWQQPLAVYTGGSSGEQLDSQTADFMARFSDPVDLAGAQASIAAAATAGQWTLVDFYADWCVSCQVMEEEIFGDPEVQEKLAEYNLLRPDVTANSPADRHLMQEWQVFGPPTFLWFDPSGHERREFRVVGEVNKADFLAILEQLKNDE